MIEFACLYIVVSMLNCAIEFSLCYIISSYLYFWRGVGGMHICGSQSCWLDRAFNFDIEISVKSFLVICTTNTTLGFVQSTQLAPWIRCGLSVLASPLTKSSHVNLWGDKGIAIATLPKESPFSAWLIFPTSQLNFHVSGEYSMTLSP